MIGLLQRVRQARVEVEQQVVGEIEQGLLVFVGFEPNDSPEIRQRMLQRILKYRVFEDEQGRMNQNLMQIEGGLLLVPQFTLAADTDKGLRPGFSTAAAPSIASKWFAEWLSLAQSQYAKVSAGQFGADMQVHLQNDGPATFILRQN